MNKKILSILVLILVVSFSTTAYASLTFTTDAITGDTASAIDLGAGNALSIQTTGNGAITTGTGLVTLGGNLSVAGSSTIPFITGNTSVSGAISAGGTAIDSRKYVNVNITGIDATPGSFYGGYFSLAGNGNNENSLTALMGEATRTSGAFSHGAIVGVQGKAVINSGLTSDAVTAFSSEAQALGGDVNQAYGLFSSVLSYTSPANIDTAYGVYSDVAAATSGNIGSARALYGKVRKFGSPSGTITSAYGLYLEDITAGTTNNYAIYSLGGKSYFAGNVGIGKTSPGSKLSVVGLPAYADNAAALAGGLTAGDFYYTDTGGEYIVKIAH